jgi:hypothetical protein
VDYPIDQIEAGLLLGMLRRPLKRSPRKEPRIVPRLGTLPAPNAASRFPHIQALIECGGLVSLTHDGLGNAVAFGTKGLMAAVRTAAGEAIQVSLRRLDWAIAIGNSTRVRVDEIYGSIRIQAIGPRDAGINRVRIPVHAGHQFRSMPGHDSGPCRATIPVDAGRGV